MSGGGCSQEAPSGEAMQIAFTQDGVRYQFEWGRRPPELEDIKSERRILSHDERRRLGVREHTDEQS